MVITLEPNAPPRTLQFGREYTVNNGTDGEGRVDLISEFSTIEKKMPAHSDYTFRLTQAAGPPGSISIQNGGQVPLTLTIDPQT